ncbi:MAG: choline-sulfatase [Acidimicrobiales bacterium]
MGPPNILILMADQLAPHFTGTYGHPLVRTPHIDALAERGARFDAAYCASPLCAPARFGMMAGQSISTIGAWDNAAEFAASIPTFAHYLREAGYQTTLSGKMHFVGPDQLHGFHERLTTDIYPADFAWTPNWDQPEHRLDQWYHNMDVLADAGQAMTTYQLDYDELVGFEAQRKLFDLARDPQAQPFLLVASFTHPHDPYVTRPEWWNLYNHDEIDLPEPTDIGALDPHSVRIRHGTEADTVGYTEAQTRNARHAYYANVSYFDDWVGRLLETLDETEMADETVVIVTSDHGDMLGDRACWFKMSFFERSARVPLVVSGPDVVTSQIPNVCSHLDIVPTLLDIATEGQWPEVAAPLSGRSLWPAATGGSDDVDETTAEYTAEMTSEPMFMIRRGAYKYIQCEGDPPLLYDVESDPLERSNLAEVSAHKGRVDAFANEAESRWDSGAIRDRVVASQRARRLVHAAGRRGSLVSWDHAPVNDVANSFMRNHHDWSEIGLNTRFPRPDA